MHAFLLINLLKPVNCDKINQKNLITTATYSAIATYSIFNQTNKQTNKKQ